MNKYLQRFAGVAVLVLALGGCKKESAQKGGDASPGASSSAAPSQHADSGEPRIGVPFSTEAQYKPIPGKPGGRIVLDTLGEPKSFNPITAGEQSTTLYTQRMFQGLTDNDAFTGEIKPLIAEKWENSSDGLTWTFHLRKDVTFNDGSPLTAQDVVFSLEDLIYDLHRPQGADPRWPCSARDMLTFDGKRVKIETPDDYTVKFTTPVKIAIFDEMAGGIRVLPRAKYAPMVADGSFGGALGADAKPEDIVGSGPFMLGRYVRGQSVTLKKNPHYWRRDKAGNAKPYLDEEVFIKVNDLNSMLLNFEQKVTDVFALSSGKEVVELKPRQQPDNFTLYQLGPAYDISFVCFNMNEDAAAAGKIPAYKVKWFRDPRFREAVSLAIDRGALVKNVLRNLGYSLPAEYTLTHGAFHYDGFPPHPHNPQKARELLGDMGFKDRDGSGVLSDPDGHKLQFTLNTNSGNTIREETCNFIRKDLQSVGMDVNALYLEFNLLVEKMDRTYDWECVMMSLGGSEDPAWGSNVWKSDGRLHLWWPRQKKPGFDWEARIDQIYQTGIQEMDKTRRKQIYREFVDITYREQPFIFLTCSERVAGLRNRFGNVFPSPAPLNALLHNEEEIFVQ